MEGRLYAVFSLPARIVSHTLRRIKAPAAFPSLSGGKLPGCLSARRRAVEASESRLPGKVPPLHVGFFEMSRQHRDLSSAPSAGERYGQRPKRRPLLRELSRIAACRRDPPCRPGKSTIRWTIARFALVRLQPATAMRTVAWGAAPAFGDSEPAI